jgi:hypothetical protein
VDLLAILRGKAKVPAEQDSITWGQSVVLHFKSGLGAIQSQSPQLVRAKRNPPTTWTILTTFRFITTPADFANAQTLNFGIVYTIGVGQTQTDVSRTFFFANGNTFADLVVNPILLPGTQTLGINDPNGGGSFPNNGTLFSFAEQMPAEDIQVRANVKWAPNVPAGPDPQCIVTCFVAPVVY